MGAGGVKHEPSSGSPADLPPTAKRILAAAQDILTDQGELERLARDPPHAHQRSSRSAAAC